MEVCETCGGKATIERTTPDGVRYLRCPCGMLRGKQIVLRTVGPFIRTPGRPKRLRVGFKIQLRKRRKP